MNKQDHPFDLIFPLNIGGIITPRLTLNCVPIKSPRYVRGDVLLGSSKSFKTSLLFQAAVTLCNNNSPTLFFKPKPLNFLPAAVNGMTRPHQISSDQMDNLNFIYVDHFQQLIAYLANFPFNSHVNSRIIGDSYALLIVDDFDHYLAQIPVDKSFEHRFAKLCCLLLEAAEFCAKKRSGRVNLLISCKGEAGAEFKFMKCFRRYFDGLWRITPSHSSNKLVIESLAGSDDIKHILIENEKDEILLKRIGTDRNEPFTEFN